MSSTFVLECRQAIEAAAAADTGPRTYKTKVHYIGRGPAHTNDMIMFEALLKTRTQLDFIPLAQSLHGVYSAYSKAYPTVLGKPWEPHRFSMGHCSNDSIFISNFIEMISEGGIGIAWYTFMRNDYDIGKLHNWSDAVYASMLKSVGKEPDYSAGVGSSSAASQSTSRHRGESSKKEEQFIPQLTLEAQLEDAKQQLATTILAEKAANARISALQSEVVSKDKQIGNLKHEVKKREEFVSDARAKLSWEHAQRTQCESLSRNYQEEMTRQRTAIAELRAENALLRAAAANTDNNGAGAGSTCAECASRAGADSVWSISEKDIDSADSEFVRGVVASGFKNLLYTPNQIFCERFIGSVGSTNYSTFTGIHEAIIKFSKKYPQLVNIAGLNSFPLPNLWFRTEGAGEKFKNLMTCCPAIVPLLLCHEYNLQKHELGSDAVIDNLHPLLMKIVN